MKTWISIAVLAILLAAFGWAVWSNLDAFSRILDFGWTGFTILTVSVFLFIFWQGLILKESVRHFDIHLKFEEWFGLIMVTFFTNYFVPFLGFGARGAYLKKVHGLSYVNYGKSLIAVLIVEWSVYALMALVALSILYLQGARWSLLLWLFMAGVVSGFFVSVIVKPSWVPSFVPLSGKLKGILADWRSYVDDRRTLSRLFFYTFLQFTGFAGAFLIAYQVLTPQVPWLASFVAAAMSDFAFLIRIAPAAAGSFEAGVYLASQTYGVDWTMSLVIATVIRLAIILVFITFGPYYFWKLIGRTGLMGGSSSDAEDSDAVEEAETTETGSNKTD